jgi:lipopolysaccharide export system permease protein
MLWMKTIVYRYLFREIAGTFLFSLGVFTLVLFMGKVLQLAELVFMNGVSITNILRLFLYLLPSFSLVTIPMSFLLAVLLTFARLSTDNEITALKSCGVSLYGLLPPVIGAAFVAYAMTAYITAYALPWGQTSFRKLMFDFLDTTQTLQLKEAVFNDQFPGLIIYTEHFNQRDSSMAGIIIHDSRDGQEASTIFARQGVISRDPEQRSVRLHLADGSIHHLMPGLGYRLISFASYDIVINFAKPVAPIVFDERYMDFGELRRSLNLPLSSKVRQDVLNEYYRRIALPFACFGFALLGVALGIQNRRTGRSGGFAFSIAILLVYYVLLSLGTTLSTRQAMPAWLAMWLPNLLFTALGVWLFRKAAQEQQFTLLERGTLLLHDIKARFAPARNET